MKKTADLADLYRLFDHGMHGMTRKKQSIQVYKYVGRKSEVSIQKEATGGVLDLGI